MFFYLFQGESTIKSQRVSENSDDYVDLTMDSLSLTNNTNTKNTSLIKSSLKNLNYKQIEPLEINYISMEEIMRVCFFLFYSFFYSFDRCFCLSVGYVVLSWYLIAC